jgi:hypothetical protein
MTNENEAEAPQGEKGSFLFSRLALTTTKKEVVNFCEDYLKIHDQWRDQSRRKEPSITVNPELDHGRRNTIGYQVGNWCIIRGVQLIWLCHSKSIKLSSSFNRTNLLNNAPLNCSFVNPTTVSFLVRSQRF